MPLCRTAAADVHSSVPHTCLEGADPFRGPEISGGRRARSEGTWIQGLPPDWAPRTSPLKRRSSLEFLFHALG